MGVGSAQADAKPRTKYPQKFFHMLIIFIMRSRHELFQSLLSSSANVIQDRQIQTQEGDQDFRRLQRKIVKELPQQKIIKPQIVEKGLFCGTVFNPNSRFIIGWYVINILLTYLYFIQVPIQVAFDKKQNEQLFYRILNIPTMLIFLVDIFINLNTSFYEDGELQTNPSKIKLQYIKTSLFFDVLSLGAIFIFELGSFFPQMDQSHYYLRYIFIIFFVRLKKVAKLQKVVLISFDLKRRTKAFFKLLLLLIKILFVCNFVASGGFMLSFYLSDRDIILNSDGTPCGQTCYWITNTAQGDTNLKNSPFSVQYVYSLYWASTTMISIGYGDITPKNSFQVGFTVVIQFMSCLLYAYAINEIWSIMLQLNKKKSRINSRLNTINLYMRDKQIGPQLNSKVNGYLTNYYYAKNLREREVENQIIAELTPALKKQLFYESYSILFKHKYFFSIIEKVIVSACQNVKEVCCYEDQGLSPRDFSPSPCLYYLKKGELIQEYGGSAKIKIKPQYKGEYIGLYQFITQLSYISQLTAVQYTLAYYIKYCYWRTALLQDRGCFEYFYLTKDSLLLYNQFARIGFKCYFCSVQDHRTEYCFDYKLRKQVKKIYLNSHRSEDQFRKPQFVRRKFNIKIGSKRSRKKSFCKVINDLLSPNKKQISLNTSLYINYDLLDKLRPQRKWSVFEQSELKRGGKFFVKPKQKHESHMLKTVREHYVNKSEDGSNQSVWIEEIKLRQINFDKLAFYQQYYPKFNCSELNPREFRRRMTRSFYF